MIWYDRVKSPLADLHWRHADVEINLFLLPTPPAYNMFMEHSTPHLTLYYMSSKFMAWDVPSGEFIFSSAFWLILIPVELTDE